MIAPGFYAPDNRCSRSSNYPWKTTLLCAAALVPGVMGQDILAPPPSPPPLMPSAVEQYQTNQAVQMQVFAPSPGPSGMQQNQPFTFGPIVIRPQIFYQFIYGNGLQSGPGSPQNVVIQEFSPGVVLQAGLHWTLNYTPTFNFYSSDAFRNTINQNAQLQWGSTWRDWFMTASQSYGYSDDPEIETAGQMEQQTYSTVLNSIYHVNDKVSVNLGLNQTLNYYGSAQSSTNLLLGFSDSRNWSTMNWLNDQFWPRFNAGIGIGMGYNQQVGSPDAVFEQYQGQIAWLVTSKISFQLSGGLQDQQYLSGGASSLITPIFSGTAQYQPFDQTKISLSLSRTVSSSAFADEDIEATTVTADFNQRLLGGLNLDVSGGYASSDYVASVFGLSTARSDDSYTFNARLSCPFPKRGTVAIFYQYSQTISSQTGFALGASAFGYTSHQVGFDISYTY